MASSEYQIGMVSRRALQTAVPRFSVYLEALALERERAAVVVNGGVKARCGCDSFEVSDEARVRLGERTGARAVPEVETVEVVRERLVSPAGRFIDLFV